ncbi:hypothetical protein [Citrobacter braakii]|uniref:hypothetical protein n=1 Tax=Citrobacter braakii TaxID=57706 RepID=UPI00397A4C99
MKPTYEQLEQQVLEQAVQLANAESKCRELAAENAGLKEVVSGVNSELYGKGFEVSGWHLNGALEPLDNWFTDNGWGMPETPATDAFLAEVRAQSASELIAAFSKHVSASGLNDSSVVTILECEDAMQHVAAQLRKGAAL